MFTGIKIPEKMIPQEVRQETVSREPTVTSWNFTRKIMTTQVLATNEETS